MKKPNPISRTAISRTAISRTSIARILPRFRLLVLAALVAIAPAAVTAGESNLGTSREPLVSPNPPVSVFDRERLGLIYLYNAQNHTECSGSLLTNLWVLTAAHCVEDLNGGRIGVPAVISVRGDWRAKQEKQAVEIVNFRPVDIAIIRLESPMRVFGSERRFRADLWRSQDGNLNGREIRVFGMGLNGFAVDKNTLSYSDDTYRWFDVNIKGQAGSAYSYAATPTQSVLGGDSGGPSYIMSGVASQKVVGVHSLDIGVKCVGNLKPCDWDFIKSVAETQDARVSLVADQIDAAIARTAPPQWSDMMVARAGRATRFLNPTVHIENDDYRADVCRTWAKDCGQSAAEQFCRTHESRFTGKALFEAAPFGHTGLVETGQTCFGAGCQAFTTITCSTGVPMSQLQEKQGGFRVNPDTHVGTETKDDAGGFAHVVPQRPDFAKYAPATVMQKSTDEPASSGANFYKYAPATVMHKAGDGPIVGEPGGFAGPAPTMTGAFDTDFGLLTLTARDGTYTVKNGRVKILKIAGDFMDGTWTQSASEQRCADGTFRGTFHFQFTKTGFNGTYGYCDGPTSAGAWNGMKHQ